MTIERYGPVEYRQIRTVLDLFQSRNVSVWHLGFQESTTRAEDSL